MKLDRLLCIGASVASAASLRKRPHKAWSDYTNNGVFYPTRNYTDWRTLYARTLQLPDLSLLLTFEDYTPLDYGLTAWPIFKSTNGGVSFNLISKVEDQVNGFGNWYQPFLYTLPEDFGGFPQGTILIAGTSTPRNLTSAYIDLYASKDEGLTWSFLSHIVHGAGPEDTTDGDKAVWEPFLFMYDGQLICYYSSQADPLYAQKLAHKTTTDLLNWSDEVNDVAGADYANRPGMASVAYSPVSKKYLITFEYCNAPDGGGCPAHYKVASSPLDFNDSPALLFVPDNVLDNPNYCPYMIYSPIDDQSGVFIMNGGDSLLWINEDAVDPNGWRSVDVGQENAYTRSLRIVDTPKRSPAKGVKKLLLGCGGHIGCAGTCMNHVSTGLVDIPTYPSS